MRKENILPGLLIALSTLLFANCSFNFIFQSNLPEKMPPKTTIVHWDKDGSYYLKDDVLSFSGLRQRSWSAKVSPEDKEEFYQLFRKNKFDLIKNYEPKEFDVEKDSSRDISLDLGGAAFYKVKYGPNYPMAWDSIDKFFELERAFTQLAKKYGGQFYQDYVIINDENSMVFVYKLEVNGLAFNNAKPAELYNSDKKTLATLITKAVEEHNAKQTDSAKIDAAKYKKQFLPVVNEKGEREVLVNGFCRPLRDWQKKFLFIKGGGNCVFTVRLNLTSEGFYDFKVNEN